MPPNQDVDLSQEYSDLIDIVTAGWIDKHANQQVKFDLAMSIIDGMLTHVVTTADAIYGIDGDYHDRVYASVNECRDRLLAIFREYARQKMGGG